MFTHHKARANTHTKVTQTPQSRQQNTDSLPTNTEIDNQTANNNLEAIPHQNWPQSWAHTQPLVNTEQTHGPTPVKTCDRSLDIKVSLTQNYYTIHQDGSKSTQGRIYSQQTVSNCTRIIIIEGNRRGELKSVDQQSTWAADVDILKCEHMEIKTYKINKHRCIPGVPKSLLTPM